jgi:hypothetical protein
MNRLHVWLGCFVMLSVCTNPLTHAHKADRPRGAEMASFFLNTAPIATGVVSRFLVTPFGEVDGLLLDSGTLVTFPPHMEHELTAAIAPGVPVAVRGQATGPTQVKALILTNTSTNQQVIEHPPGPAEASCPNTCAPSVCGRYAHARRCPTCGMANMGRSKTSCWLMGQRSNFQKMSWKVSRPGCAWGRSLRSSVMARKTPMAVGSKPRGSA